MGEESRSAETTTEIKTAQPSPEDFNLKTALRGPKDGVKFSPLNALSINPPFKDFHLIDMDSDKAEQLRKLTAGQSNAHIYEGDCNEILLKKVFPQVQYAKYRRELCLLDPYGLHLDWSVIQTAGQMQSVEIFVNFPVADMNRNVLWRDTAGVAPEQAERMTAFWGDEIWKKAAYGHIQKPGERSGENGWQE